ncbi:MAG: methyltransferase domain-containing protein [Nanoarchaeota archaeon]|nr:methyltransferase domain-containing protein [Nanoarchaeota archaeon]
MSKINKKSKILEIGCGSRKTTQLFAEKGYNIFGIDISFPRIAL